MIVNMTTLRRTILVDAVGIRTSGGANVLLGLVCELAAKFRHVIFVVCVLSPSHRSFSTSLFDRAPNVRVVEVTWASGDLMRLLWILFGVTIMGLRTGCDAVLCLANLAAPFAFEKSIVLLHQPHAISSSVENRPKGLRQKVHSLLVKACLYRATRIAVQTDAMREVVCAWSPQLCQRVAVVMGGLCLQENKGQDACQSDGAEELDSVQRISFVSFAAKHKNFGTLLEAFAQVLKENPNVRLYLTVDPLAAVSPEYTSCMAEIVRRISELDLAGKVTLTGILPQDQVLTLLRASTIHVFLSRAESLGLPILEAMSLGVPQVLSDLPYAHAVAGAAALYADPEDPSDCARVMLKLLRDRDLRTSLGSIGRQRARQFSYSEMAVKMMELIDG